MIRNRGEVARKHGIQIGGKGGIEPEGGKECAVTAQAASEQVFSEIRDAVQNHTGFDPPAQTVPQFREVAGRLGSPETGKKRGIQLTAVAAEDIPEEPGLDEVINVCAEPVEGSQYDAGANKTDKKVSAVIALTSGGGCHSVPPCFLLEFVFSFLLLYDITGNFSILKYEFFAGPERLRVIFGQKSRFDARPQSFFSNKTFSAAEKFPARAKKRDFWMIYSVKAA